MSTLVLCTDDRLAFKYKEKLNVYSSNYIRLAFTNHKFFREFCDDCELHRVSMFFDWTSDQVNQYIVPRFLNTVASKVISIYEQISYAPYVDLNSMFHSTPKNKWMAACGTLFAKIASDCEHMVIISNNDYVLNRITMDIRDKVCGIKPEDFEIEFNDASPNIKIDNLGNVIGAPEEYRVFEMGEINRQLWGKDNEKTALRKEVEEKMKERIGQ